MGFQSEVPFDKRKEEALRIRTKYPELIPVICEKTASSTDLPTIDRRKYLVPPDLTVGQLLYVVRKRIQMKPDKALFMFVNGAHLAPSSQLLTQVYDDHKDDDGFLYFSYSSENTFG